MILWDCDTNNTKHTTTNTIGYFKVTIQPMTLSTYKQMEKEWQDRRPCAGALDYVEEECMRG